jgi:hypothetical protein
MISVAVRVGRAAPESRLVSRLPHIVEANYDGLFAAVKNVGPGSVTGVHYIANQSARALRWRYASTHRPGLLEPVGFLRRCAYVRPLLPFLQLRVLCNTLDGQVILQVSAAATLVPSQPVLALRRLRPGAVSGHSAAAGAEQERPAGLPPPCRP